METICQTIQQNDIRLTERMDYLEDKINLLELQINKLNEAMRSYEKLRVPSIVSLSGDMLACGDVAIRNVSDCP